MERPEGVLQGIAEDHEVRLLYSQLVDLHAVVGPVVEHGAVSCGVPEFDRW
ncbi:MAG TPA: hypothetical protein VGR06_36695 [Actinophytocola sp.]|uniref:hypothetical protein n=1 Tax=Actinophytocola sp. TaxID=1872138 RepID=UPI002E0B9886|nr:hypothetical protein [Actinophytocola sp.]